MVGPEASVSVRDNRKVHFSLVALMIIVLESEIGITLTAGPVTYMLLEILEPKLLLADSNPNAYCLFLIIHN